MEGEASDEENRNLDDRDNNKTSNSNEGMGKPKRQMKTPFQLETLEKAYAMETYPGECSRIELSKKLGLTDRQLQMWFCHRRLKDKKEAPAKKNVKMVPAALPDSPSDDLRMGADPGSDYGSGSGSSPFGHTNVRNAMPWSGGDDIRTMRKIREPSQSLMELRAIACVEAQLGEPLKEDGPILGIEFDSLPPDAFGASIEVATEQLKRSGNRYDGRTYERRDSKSNKATPRTFHDFSYLQDVSSIRTDIYGQITQSHYADSVVEVPSARTSSFLHGNEQSTRTHGFHGYLPRARLLSQKDKEGIAIPSPSGDDDFIPPRSSYTNNRINNQLTDHPAIGPENPYLSSDGRSFQNDDILWMERKHKSGAKISKDGEAHEIRIRKELEKQDALRKKGEERIRKEMEKQDRERKKEEEKLLRERQREVERLKREKIRENERRERFLEKENMRAEKRKQKEELRKEREEVRRQAAVEKANARRIARESMELIEDEQLELMELAVSRKGLLSIANLDYDTLQNLDSFRDFMGSFPPKTVHLKRPFGVKPWTISEENIGNLLMVWRFLITFADILELWPFTLDEFVQAFHDYDSRLLGEIHISLLRLIIKDIEDVARMPSTGLGMNQNGVVNPGGGHPQIVEGAYGWGFDICKWQRHLNPLTWPEIFRQLALSAGFGPQLKKRSIKWSDVRDNNESKGCEDVVSTLRNGSAAENAFALMQERGLLAPRKSRHRLTPGTVKFAAFHVLSLEGSKGLTVVDLADKIQKSALRDLSTSKTPEASISVALTRDTKLFERIAPSTYRVRAPYRKDPIDSEEILSSARKKIQIFQNGFLPCEDVERDEESECDDIDEDPEVDDLGTPTLENKNADKRNEEESSVGNGKETLCPDVLSTPQNEFDKDMTTFPFSVSNDAKYSVSDAKQYSCVPEITNLDQENMEIDESKAGELWVQGLTEGEYFGLSVVERLNALVALIGIANEGNSIRVVLEDRLEAANALKKQMWAEAQVDKSRPKDELVPKSDFPSIMGIKAEAQHCSTLDGGQSPFPDVDNRSNQVSPSNAENQKSLNGFRTDQDLLNCSRDEKGSVPQDFSVSQDNLLQQIGNATKKSRSQLKSYLGFRAEEMYTYRSLPLGRDRKRNRYWQFVASASSNDPGSGRIFVELHDGHWRLIDSEEAFDSLLISLDTRGIRESNLRLMLQNIETFFKENVRRSVQLNNLVVASGTCVKSCADEMECSPTPPAALDSPSSAVCGLNLDMMVTSSSFKIDLGRNETEKQAALKRYQEFQRWAWGECLNTLSAMKYGKTRCKQLLDNCEPCLSSYNSEHSHCLSCHQTFDSNDLNFSDHLIYCEESRKLKHGEMRALDSTLPLGSRLVKTVLALIESSIPSEALESCWTEEHRSTWGLKLNMSSSIEELLQMLTQLERVIKRNSLSASFSTTQELLGSMAPLNLSCDPKDSGSDSILPWIPRTVSAVSLRLFELDASIMYCQSQKSEPGFDDEDKLMKPHAPMKESMKNELCDLDYGDLMREDHSVGLSNARNRSKRGRGDSEQGRGKKWQRQANNSNTNYTRRVNKASEKSNKGLRRVGQGSHAQGGRGRRTIRKRRAETTDKALLGQINKLVLQSIGDAPKDFSLDWDGDEKINTDIRKEEDDIDNIDAIDSDDDARVAGYDGGNWDVRSEGPSSTWKEDAMEGSDEDVDAFEDDNVVEEAGNEDSEGEADLSEDVSDGMENGVGNGEGGDSSVSEDYSD